MRVLITTDAVGGVWTFTSKLVVGLLNADCDVAVACVGRAPSADQLRWVSEVEGKYGKRFHFATVDAPLEWEQDNQSALAAGAPALLRFAKDFRADLVHSNQFCFGMLSIDLPVVVTAHSDVLSWFQACHGTPPAESPWLLRYCSLVNDGLLNATAVTAPTRWMLTALREHFPLDREAVCPGLARASVIYNGRSLPRPDEQHRVLRAVTAGRLWDPAKNVSILADVTVDMPLLVAGDAAYAEAEAPQAFGKAELLGRLAEDDLLSLLRTSAIYLCTSRYEPFGLAPLEAALCGCALVCYDLPSLREVWGDAALYYRDAASLGQVLHRLASDPALLARTQARCLAHARHYTAEAMTAAYLRLYRTTVSRPEAAIQEEARAA